MQFIITNFAGNGPLPLTVLIPKSEDRAEDDDVSNGGDSQPDIQPGEIRVLNVHDDARVEFTHAGPDGFEVEARVGGNLHCVTYPPGEDRVALDVDKPMRQAVAHERMPIYLVPTGEGERVIIDRVIDLHANRSAA